MTSRRKHNTAISYNLHWKWPFILQCKQVISRLLTIPEVEYSSREQQSCYVNLTVYCLYCHVNEWMFVLLYTSVLSTRLCIFLLYLSDILFHSLLFWSVSRFPVLMGTKHAGLPGRPALHWRDFLAAINLSICRSIYAAIYLSIKCLLSYCKWQQLVGRFANTAIHRLHGVAQTSTH